MVAAGIPAEKLLRDLDSATVDRLFKTVMDRDHAGREADVAAAFLACFVFPEGTVFYDERTGAEVDVNFKVIVDWSGTGKNIVSLSRPHGVGKKTKKKWKTQ